MKIVIDESDFQRLRPDIQSYLLDRFAKKKGGAARHALKPRDVHWCSPMDLSQEDAQHLVHGLSEDQKKRLALFTKKGGRVTMKDILALTGETNLRATTQLQTAITRRLRRIIGDTEKKAQLIAWDFDATKWDAKKTTIVDGVYYVSQKTSDSLKHALGGKARGKKTGKKGK